MKNIKLLIISCLILSLFLSHNILPAQDIKDNSLYFMSTPGGLPSPYRKPWIDTLTITYNNHDTLAFSVSGQSFFKTGNKIYAYDLLGMTDTFLLFDYDLVVGDTFITNPNAGHLVNIVDSVRSVQYEDGNFYKEWFLSGSKNIKWMENLGSNKGWIWIFPHPANYVPALEAICHNSDVIYWNFGMLGDGSYPDPTCNFDSLRHILPVSEINYQNKISVFPNPTTSEIYISDIENGHFEIINLLGKTMLQGTVQNKINVLALTDGVYLIRIISPEGTYTTKFVKQ
jgi:hypothetical protein